MVDEKLMKKFVKKKSLQKLGNSLVLIVPKTWLKALAWNQQTDLTMAFHPDEGKIIIKKSDLKKEEEDNGEETGNPILV